MTSDAFEFAYCTRPDESIVARAAAIRCLALDADGVLTDGAILTGPQGEDIKAFHVHDGKGLALLRAAGIGLAIVTARESAALAARCRELGICELRQGVRDKAAALEQLAHAQSLDTAELAYVGDDIVDLGALGRSGLAVSVANAHPLVIARSHWTTGLPGGRGAVREVCELLLAARGELASIFRDHG